MPFCSRPSARTATACRLACFRGGRVGAGSLAAGSRFARLPGKTAIERLALLIGKMPNKGWAHPDAVAVATRLIVLLPKQFFGSREPSTQSLGAVMNSKPWWVYVVRMSFVLGSQFLIASRQLPPKADNVKVNASEIGRPAVVER
jgi:hypothetical protein